MAQGYEGYPNGWFVVAFSDDLGLGDVRPMKYFGTELVAFRGEDGQVRVLDGHCSHMGAHLGHGGQVKGNHIECPFHAWCYDGDGTCVAIPYAEKIPTKAAPLRNLPTMMRAGLMVVMYSKSALALARSAMDRMPT